MLLAPYQRDRTYVVQGSVSPGIALPERETRQATSPLFIVVGATILFGVCYGLFLAYRAIHRNYNPPLK